MNWDNFRGNKEHFIQIKRITNRFHLYMDGVDTGRWVSWRKPDHAKVIAYRLKREAEVALRQPVQVLPFEDTRQKPEPPEWPWKSRNRPDDAEEP